MAADGSIVFEASIDDKNAQTKLNQLKDKIQRLQNSLEKSTGEQSNIKKKLDSAKAAAQETEKEIKRIMEALQAELALNEDIASGKVSLSDEELQRAAERQDALVAKLKEQQALLKKQDSTVQSLGKQYDRVTEKIESQTQELNRTKEEAAEYARQVIEASKSQNVMTDMAKKASAAMEKLGARIKTIAKSALIFSVIAAALRALKDIMGQAISQSKEASAAVAKLKGALLSLAQPIIEVLLPVFTALVNILAKIVTAVAKFVSLLFGKSFSQTKQNAKALNTQNKALNSQKEAIEGVGEAAEKASGSLADFDELTTISYSENKPSSSTVGDLGLDGDSLAPDFSDLDADVSIFDNLVKRLQKIWQDIKNIFKDLKDIVVNFFTGNWGDMLESINNLFWHIQDLISDILLFLSEGFGDIIDWIIQKFNLAGTPIGQALEGIKGIVQGAIEFVINFLNLNLDGVLNSVTKFMTGLQNLLYGIINFVQSGVNSLLTWLNNVTGGQLSGFIEFVKSVFNGCFSFIKEVAGAAFAGLKDMLNGIITLLNGLFSANWKQAWQGLMQFVKGIATTIAGVFGSALNVIIRALNWMIRQINRISITVPDWVPGIGGRTIGFNIPAISEVTIPRLAQGAVIPPNREFLAVLGDQTNGTNVEAPLSTIQQAAVQAFAEMGPEFARYIVQAFVEAGMLGNIRAIEDYARVTAQKDFTLGKPSSSAGRWVSQSMEAYEAVRG